MQTHNIALDVVKNSTSSRRYGPVMVLAVPDDVKEAWLSANKQKSKCNPLLARVDVKSMWVATLKNTHFVGAQKLIAEGDRAYKDLKDGKALKLKEGDAEGKLIQTHGVSAQL